MKKLNLKLTKLIAMLGIIILSIFICTESLSASPPRSELTASNLRRKN